MTTSYATLLLDPPWLERGAGQVKRGADRHYPLLKTHEMPEVIYGSGVWNPHPCGHAYMWVTNNFLPDGLWLLDVLGFRYVTNLSWRKRRKATMKDLRRLMKLAEKDEAAALAALQALQDACQTGLGQYFRGQHELLLFGVKKGASPTTLLRSKRKDLTSVINAERSKHSAKPPEAHDIIEARTVCPLGMGRLEMFARSERPGWDSWGNEL